MKKYTDSKNIPAIKKPNEIFNSNINKSIFLILVFLFPQLAMAQVGLDLLDQIVEWTTDEYAIGFAVLALAFVGYKWLWARELQGKVAVPVLAGIFLIFGAPTILDEIRDYI